MTVRKSTWLALVGAATIALLSQSFITEPDERIENSKEPPDMDKTSMQAMFHVRSDDHTNYEVCWKPKPGEYEGNPICTETVTKAKSSFMFTTVGHHFTVSASSPTSNDQDSSAVVFQIVGGQHNYDVDAIYRAGSTPVVPASQPVVYVRTPDLCPVDAWESVGGLWRDAIRRAAYRRGAALCLCGDFNSTTSFTTQHANPEVSTVLTPLHAEGVCRCDRPPGAAYYDLWWPCGVDGRDAEMLLDHEPCTAEERRLSDSTATHQPFEQTRLGVIHSTIMVDRLSMKGKMWESLKAVFGFDRASMVMPQSFYTIYPDSKAALLKLCKSLTPAATSIPATPITTTTGTAAAATEEADHYFIVKNEALHRQQGISITSAANIVADAGSIKDDYTFATQFLPRPYTVQGYKLNMRRYMVAVCQGGRLRGYVHDDGKNIFTKDKYVEPWEIKAEEVHKRDLAKKGHSGFSDLDLLRGRLDDLITTGYVPVEHYHDKPLSGLEFFSLVAAYGGNHTLFQQSMWTRLALTLHASRTHEDYDLCEMDEEPLRARPVPRCLRSSIRFQVGGDGDERQ